MWQNDHQYKVGNKILVKRKKNSKHELESMVPFPITQINDNGTVRFQKGIINDATNICRINHSLTKQQKSFYNTLVSLYQNDNGTVRFQQGIFNDATDYISTSHISLLWYPAP